MERDAKQSTTRSKSKVLASKPMKNMSSSSKSKDENSTNIDKISSLRNAQKKSDSISTSRTTKIKTISSVKDEKKSVSALQTNKPRRTAVETSGNYPKIIKRSTPTSSTSKPTSRNSKTEPRGPSNFVKNTPLNVTINSPKKSKNIDEPLVEHDFSAESRDFIDEKSHRRYLTRTLDPKEVQIAHAVDIAKQNFDALQNISKNLETNNKICTTFFIDLKNEEKNEVDQDYEDDFEDYESDFETFDSTKNTTPSSEDVEDIFDEKNTETEQAIVTDILKTDSPKHISLGDEGFDENSGGFSSSSLSGLDMNKKQENQKRQERISDLLKLITLDKVHYSVFTMNPIDYDTFIKSFGKSNYVQRYCQTNGDNVDKMEETDIIQTENKWTQNPLQFSPFDIVKTQKSKSLSIVEIKKMNSPIEIYRHQKYSCSTNVPTIDQQYLNTHIPALTKFVYKAAEAMLKQLSKNNKLKSNGVSRDSTVHFGKLNESISLPDFKHTILNGRPPTILKMSTTSSKYFITVHPEKKNANEEFARMKFEQIIQNRCLICLWHKDSLSSEPCKILVTSGVVRSSIFTGELFGMVAVGLENGILCCWDLKTKNDIQDIISVYKRRPEKGTLNEIVLKFSTFNTSHEIFQPNEDKTHRYGPLIDIAMKENYGGVLQLLSLHEFGMLTLWNITLEENLDSVHKFKKVFQIPLPLMKMDKSLDETVVSRCRLVSYIQAEDTGHVLVLCDRNRILHYLENGQKGKPAFYKSEDDWIELHTVAGNAKSWPYFLVGCSNFVVLLYNLAGSLPIKSFDAAYSVALSPKTTESSVAHLWWSCKKPGVFFAITTGGIVITWDILQSDTSPLFVDTLDGFPGVREVRLYEDQHYVNSSQLISTSTDKLDVYLINQQISRQRPDEMDLLHEYFHQL